MPRAGDSTSAGHAPLPVAARRRGAQGRVAARDELAEAGLEQAALEQHVAPAAPAAEPDVGAEAIDLPLAGSAGMGSPKPNDVAQVQLEDGPAGHRRESIRGGVAHRSGGPVRSDAGSVMDYDRRDREPRQRVRRGHLGDHAPGPCQRAGRDLGAADRPDLERVADRLVLDRERAGRPGDHRPNDPDAGDRDGLGAGIAELVQEVLDPVAPDGALDRDAIPAATGVIAGPGADALEVRGQLVDGRLATLLRGDGWDSWRWSSAISSRSWSLPVVRLR